MCYRSGKKQDSFFKVKKESMQGVSQTSSSTVKHHHPMQMTIPFKLSDFTFHQFHHASEEHKCVHDCKLG